MEPKTLTNAPWELKCLTSTRHHLNPETYDATYESAPGYRYDGARCGQHVNVYVLDENVYEAHVALRKPSDAPPRDSTAFRQIQEQALQDQEQHDEFKVQFTKIEYEDHHGTFVAAVVRGVAEQANIIPRYYYALDDELCNTVIGAVRPVVVNISSAITSGPTETRTLVNLIKAGVHVILAAGNVNMPLPEKEWDLSGIPDADKEHIKSVIFVGASTTDDRRYGSNVYGSGNGSAYGPIVDLFAPGHNITGATHGDHPYSRTNLNGTSFAAPLVTGIIACLLSDNRYKDISPAAMKKKILDMALDDVIQDAPILDLVKWVLTQDLTSVIEKFRRQNLTRRAMSADDVRAELIPLFKEKALSRVSPNYYQEFLLPVTTVLVLLNTGFQEMTDQGFKGLIRDDEATLKTKIYETLTMEHVPGSTVLAFKTTKKLASCHRDRWSRGDP